MNPLETRLTPSQEGFLRKVERLNEQYSAIRLGSTTERLVSSFWCFAEIAQAPAIQADWQVPTHLIPFYGDWHHLFCLNSATNEIVYLDDDRKELHCWPSLKAFSAALVTGQEASAPHRSVRPTNVWLDPELLDD